MLSDDTKRKEYDTYGQTSEEMGRQGGGFRPGGGAGFGPQGFSQNWQYRSTIDPEELFRKIFGDAAFRQDSFDDFADSKFGFGAAQEVVMTLTFAQAARGVNKDIDINVIDTCPKCFGSRCEPGTKPGKCHYCNGTGMETISTGPFVMRSTCRYCAGTRQYIKYPCNECDAKGQTVQRKRVTVPVPAGVEDGQTVRMSIGGNKELFITFKVEKSRYFKRDGADVHTDAEVSLSQAILGGTIRVQGVYEDQTLQIMPGTSSHHTITLKSKGMKRVNSMGNGDHYVHLKIVIPKKLSDKQRALIQVRTENFISSVICMISTSNPLQAYAELEKDTPGQIHGITYKSDGKSSSADEADEKVSEKFTQRPKSEDFYYEESDVKETQDYKERTKFSTYFGFGFAIVVILVTLLQADVWTRDELRRERDRVMSQYGDANEYPVGQPARKPKENSSPFDEA